MVIIPNVIGRQPYPGNPAVRDENGGLRKRGHGNRIRVLRESWSEAAGLRRVVAGRIGIDLRTLKCAHRISIQTVRKPQRRDQERDKDRNRSKASTTSASPQRINSTRGGNHVTPEQMSADSNSC